MAANVLGMTTDATAGNSDENLLRHRAGAGSWPAFQELGLNFAIIQDAAKHWAEALRGIDRPWLCWNVAHDWCLVQQNLVRSVGWTPVVGFDPRTGPPPQTVEGAVVVDFNRDLGLPVLYPHFPLEFAFLFCDKIAFWHSDLLLRPEMMAKMARRFEALPDGWTAATKKSPGLRYTFSKKHHRYFELVGCTTRLASRRQFESGCGWWRPFWMHPNCPEGPERAKREQYHWDHGGGIYYWHKHCGGQVLVLRSAPFDEGHFTKMGNPNYKRQFAHNTSNALRVMGTELTGNYDLAAACDKLGLRHLL